MLEVTPSSSNYYIPIGTESVKITAPGNRNIYVFGQKGYTVQGQASATLLAGQSVVLTLSNKNYDKSSGNFTQAPTDTSSPTFKAQQVEKLGENVLTTKLKGLTSQQAVDFTENDNILTAFGKVKALIAAATGAVSSVFGRTGAVTAQSGDYNAAQVTATPYGTLVGTTVEAQLRELNNMWMPSSTWSIYTDWDGVPATATINSDRWQFSNQNNGTAATIASSGNRFGICQISTAGGTVGGVLIGTGSVITLGYGETYFEHSIRIPILSTAAQPFTVRIGAVNAVGGDGTDGVFFRYTHGTNGGAWQIVSRSGSIETATNLTDAPVAGTWYKLGIFTNAAGTLVTYFIDNLSKGTINTNIPTAAPTSFALSIVKLGVGVQARTLDVDWSFAYCKFTAR